MLYSLHWNLSIPIGCLEVTIFSRSVMDRVLPWRRITRLYWARDQQWIIYSHQHEFISKPMPSPDAPRNLQQIWIKIKRRNFPNFFHRTSFLKAGSRGNVAKSVSLLPLPSLRLLLATQQPDPLLHLLGPPGEQVLLDVVQLGLKRIARVQIRQRYRSRWRKGVKAAGGLGEVKTVG